MEETIKLKELLGDHVLTGVDLDSIDGAMCVRFVLDGRVIIAVEDPDDGYRSMLENIWVKNEGTVKNMFPPCKVTGAWDKMGEHITRWSEGEPSQNLLAFTDNITQKPVLTIGTDYGDHYYPMFVGDFAPENMLINQGKNV